MGVWLNAGSVVILLLWLSFTGSGEAFMVVLFRFPQHFGDVAEDRLEGFDLVARERIGFDPLAMHAAGYIFWHGNMSRLLAVVAEDILVDG